MPHCPADPSDPESYTDWQPEDFPAITPEEIDLLGCDVMDRYLAGPDPVDKLVKAVRAYFAQRSLIPGRRHPTPAAADPYAGTRRRLAMTVEELVAGKWEIDDCDEATILAWCGSDAPPDDAVRWAVAGLWLLVYESKGCDRRSDVDRAVVDLNSVPEEIARRETDELHRDDSERAETIVRGPDDDVAEDGAVSDENVKALLALLRDDEDDTPAPRDLPRLIAEAAIFAHEQGITIEHPEELAAALRDAGHRDATDRRVRDLSLIFGTLLDGRELPTKD